MQHMQLKWTNVREIVEALQEGYPTQDPTKIKFTDLYKWVCGLENFGDDPKRCNERILEAIQSLWIEEVA